MRMHRSLAAALATSTLLVAGVACLLVVTGWGIAFQGLSFRSVTGAPLTINDLATSPAARSGPPLVVGTAPGAGVALGAGAVGAGAPGTRVPRGQTRGLGVVSGPGFGALPAASTSTAAPGGGGNGGGGGDPSTLERVAGATQSLGATLGRTAGSAGAQAGGALGAASPAAGRAVSGSTATLGAGVQATTEAVAGLLRHPGSRH